MPFLAEKEIDKTYFSYGGDSRYDQINADKQHGRHGNKPQYEKYSVYNIFKNLLLALHFFTFYYQMRADLKNKACSLHFLSDCYFTGVAPAAAIISLAFAEVA